MSAYIKFTTNCFTMAKQKHFSKSQSEIATLLQCAPPWFVRDGCTFTKSTGKIHLNFAKACSCGQRQQPMSVGKLRGLERAEKVGTTLVRLHSYDQASTATAGQCSCNRCGGFSAAGSRNRTARKGTIGATRCISGLRAPG